MEYQCFTSDDFKDLMLQLETWVLATRPRLIDVQFSDEGREYRYLLLVQFIA